MCVQHDIAYIFFILWAPKIYHVSSYKFVLILFISSLFNYSSLSPFNASIKAKIFAEKKVQIYI